jgi:hypothetical protein
LPGQVVDPADGRADPPGLASHEQASSADSVLIHHGRGISIGDGVRPILGRVGRVQGYMTAQLTQ